MLGNNRWLISGQGSGIDEPRQAPGLWPSATIPRWRSNCWCYGYAARAEGPLRRPTTRSSTAFWSFSKNKAAAKDVLLNTSNRSRLGRQAGGGLDRGMTCRH